MGASTPKGGRYVRLKHAKSAHGGRRGTKNARHKEGFPTPGSYMNRLEVYTATLVMVLAPDWVYYPYMALLRCTAPGLCMPGANWHENIDSRDLGVGV